MRKISLASALLLFLIGNTVLPAGATAEFDFRRGFAHVAREATPAVVFIQVEKRMAHGRHGEFLFGAPGEFFGDEFFERFFGRRMPQRQPGSGGRERSFVQTGQGSGFIISKDGYILTNSHVIDGADRIRVKLKNGKEYRAQKIGADNRTEVAVIKIDAEEELPIVKLGDVAQLETGEWVVAIGNPFGLEETLTVGVVSAKGRSGIGIADYEDFIQTDAAINPGNSGGPLLNINGEVVGINTAIYSRSGGYMGIGFAVPIDMAIGIKDQLVSDGKVTRGYLGVLLNPGDLTAEMAQSFGMEGDSGVLIADVLSGSPADKAGLKAGDIIIALEGEAIGETRRFRAEVAKLRPGSKVNLTLFRDGKEKRVSVTIGTAPEGNETSAGETESEDEAAMANRLGLSLQQLSAEMAQRPGYKESKGVLVVAVEPGSPAARAGLVAGSLIESVNRKVVTTPQEFNKVAAGSHNEGVLLQVRSQQGQRFFLLLKPEEE